MRRSAAPSQLYAKRPRFNPPISQETSKSKASNFEVSGTTPYKNSSSVPQSESGGERTKEDILKLITEDSQTISGGQYGQKPSSPSVSANSQLSLAGGTLDSDSKKESFTPSLCGLTSKRSSPCGLGSRKSFSVPSKGFKSPLTKTNGPNSISSENKSNSTLDGETQKDSSVEGETSQNTKQKPGQSKGQMKFCPPSVSREPLVQKNQPQEASVSAENTEEPKTCYYNIVWCKLSKKKHKKWEGDAIMKTKGRTVTLIDTEGKEIGRGSGYKVAELASMAEGHTLAVGGKEIEVMSLLKEEDYKSGKCFQTATMVTDKAAAPKPRAPVVSKPFVKPQLSGSAPVQPLAPTIVRPKFDPEAPDALVMPRPNQNHQWEHNRQGLNVVDVVVDPHVAYHLRPHQREGVVFLYQCVMGMKDFTGQGAILADEMGLGKTLQCISLIWTLYKQGPYGGKPAVRRTLVITPGSLVKNWVREFKKWLGSERLKVFAVGTDNKATDFAHCTVYPVMIISYEMFIRNIDAIKAVNFDLVVCDEGHRLKNTNIKTTSFMMSLTTRRRVVLTGTPVQNDLKELFSIVEFCNPGILGTSSAFHHVYEAPILASRQPSASAADTALGETRAQELNRVTGMFILRRTQDINNKYLPPKVEVVLFCRPSGLQLQLYRRLLSSRAVRSCLTSAGAGGDSAQHLMCIAAMKKLCNCPSLLHANAVTAHHAQQRENHAGQEEPELYRDLLPLYPADYDPHQLAVDHSGKLSVLTVLLRCAHQASPRQRVVLVSNYTQTLDVLERLCVAESYTFLRLDGQTPTAKRQQLVERFNDKYSNVFVFLLSSKAGGVGLNLIGASRLILYDIDWNPANDLQAMARIWRDGQKNRVYIYRLLTTGSLEEKMYQRQVSKQGLSGVVVDAKANSKLHFSPEELKDLFRLREDSLCCTHDLLDCDCGTTDHTQGAPPGGEPVLSRPCQLQTARPTATKKNLCMDELMEWRHEKGPVPDLGHVDPLVGDTKVSEVTYAFWNVSGQQEAT